MLGTLSFTGVIEGRALDCGGNDPAGMVGKALPRPLSEISSYAVICPAGLGGVGKARRGPGDVGDCEYAEVGDNGGCPLYEDVDACRNDEPGWPGMVPNSAMAEPLGMR